MRTAKNGDTVFFNVNRHLNLTNVCSASCAYCSFQRKPGQKDAYTMRVEEAVEKALAMKDDGLTELHIVNGLHPTLPWKYYPRVLRELKAALPQVALKAFTATEVHWFEEISGLSADEILDELIDAGLESLTGGGAEIFDWDVRKQIVDHKTHWEDWSRIHRLAHQKGLRTPATMLYGHIEEPRHRVDHVMRLRELQDETGGFQVFIPLRFHNDNNRLSHLPMAQPADVLKTFAVSRLMLDNFPHVKVFWVMHGLSTSQLALNYGADDMDGSVVEYKITHDADGFGTPDKLTRDDLLALIRDAGFTPKERNTRYEVIREYDGPVPLAERRAEPQAHLGLGRLDAVTDQHAAAGEPAPQGPSFVNWMGSLWGYTILRFGLFFALWGLLLLVGLGGLLAAAIALVLSVPLVARAAVRPAQPGRHEHRAARRRAPGCPSRPGRPAGPRSPTTTDAVRLTRSAPRSRRRPAASRRCASAGRAPRRTSAAPPTAWMRAAPGSQSHGSDSICTQPPSRPAATAASSIDPEPSMRTVAAPCIARSSGIAHAVVGQRRRVQVARDRHLRRAAGRSVGGSAAPLSVVGCSRPPSQSSSVGGLVDRAEQRPVSRRRARAPSTTPAARTGSCTCRRPGRRTRCASPGDRRCLPRRPRRRPDARRAAARR